LEKKNCTNRQKQNIFLALIPHRDTRIVLQKYCEILFKAGLADVYPFPCAVPLAAISHQLTDEKLKHIARRLREAISGEGAERCSKGMNKFCVTEISSATLSINNEDITLLGPKLEFNLKHVNDIETEEIKSFISPAVIGFCLVPKENEQKILSSLKLNIIPASPLPELSFRAAAISNMFWKPVKLNGEIGYKWKIGKLYWLPKTLI